VKGQYKLERAQRVHGGVFKRLRLAEKENLSGVLGRGVVDLSSGFTAWKGKERHVGTGTYT
jgi:hypothetical protein